MAAYDYRCRTCGDVFEVRRRIAEDAADVRCPGGHPEVARVWSAVAVTGRAGTTTVRRTAPATAGGCCGGGCCN